MSATPVAVDEGGDSLRGGLAEERAEAGRSARVTTLPVAVVASSERMGVELESTTAASVGRESDADWSRTGAAGVSGRGRTAWEIIEAVDGDEERRGGFGRGAMAESRWRSRGGR